MEKYHMFFKREEEMHVASVFKGEKQRAGLTIFSTPPLHQSARGGPMVRPAVGVSG